jgi:hypothetical protein
VLLALLAVASIAIEVTLVMGYKLPSPIYLWTAPAWLAWYLFARAASGEPVAEQPATEA